MNGSAMQGVDLDSISQTGCGSRRSPLSPTTCGPCSEVFPEAASSGAAKEQWTRQTDIDAWLIWNIWQVANSACRMGCKALHGGDRYSNPERHELVDSAIERPLSVPSL
jgi:hypothetical protein